MRDPDADTPLLAAAEKSGQLVFKLVDIGPVIEWGKPANAEHIASWPAYFLSIWSELDALPGVILVDGRFRVACATAPSAAPMASPPQSTTAAAEEGARLSSMAGRYGNPAVCHHTRGPTGPACFVE